MNTIAGCFSYFLHITYKQNTESKKPIEPSMSSMSSICSALLSLCYFLDRTITVVSGSRFGSPLHSQIELNAWPSTFFHQAFRSTISVFLYTFWTAISLPLSFTFFKQFVHIYSPLLPCMLGSVSTFEFQTLDFSQQLLYVFLVWCVHRAIAAGAPPIRSTLSSSDFRAMVLQSNFCCNRQQNFIIFYFRAMVTIDNKK